MKLPNGKNAFIDSGKLTGYALNPINERGKHKARVFASTLGITTKNADVLRDALLEAARTGTATRGRSTPFGQLYTVDFDLSTSKGEARIRSGWIIRDNENFPRLTTVFVL